MSFIRRSLVLHRVVLGVTVLLATAASAAVESSCPAPCTTPPKSALFVRETAGILAANGKMVPLAGTLLKGQRKTVLRVDASLRVYVNNANAPDVLVQTLVNGRNTVPYLYSAVCDGVVTGECSVTGTFWFDIDALEAAHPGEYLNQPLDISVQGGNVLAQGVSLLYEASFSAQVVKKK